MLSMLLSSPPEIGYRWIVTRYNLAAALLVTALCFSQQGSDPWIKAELIEPASFAETLRSDSGKPDKILCVAFPILYRSRHIKGAIFAGPGNRAEGIEALKKEVAGLAKDTDIVLYCGCCPMEKCPNLRPAYRTLKELGFTRVRVLNIPTNMHTDWYTKGYPSEPESGSAAR